MDISPITSISSTFDRVLHLSTAEMDVFHEKASYRINPRVKSLLFTFYCLVEDMWKNMRQNYLDKLGKWRIVANSRWFVNQVVGGKNSLIVT